MIFDFLDFMVGHMLPDFILLLNSLMIAPGVSWLGFIIAVTLLCVVIGSILLRVS